MDKYQKFLQDRRQRVCKGRVNELIEILGEIKGEGYLVSFPVADKIDKILEEKYESNNR